ncbi:MAG: FAD:protein FMN transferase [Candidatus Kryptonium sp.]|nr:FAD:protein FMN transferase [Candidatus Kryptonium sp.]
MSKIAHFVLILTLLTQISSESVFSQGASYHLMGTYAYIELSPQNLNHTAYKYLKEIEAKLSDYIDSSEISKINSNAGYKFIKISDIALEVIKEAVLISKRTWGIFDITVGALTINSKRLKKFSEDSAYKLINFNDIVISGDSIMLAKKGMAIDLGGIGKGFAIQKVHENLKAKLGFISIGGDMKVWGHKRTLAIKNPLNDDVLVQMVNSKDVALSTSGNYLQKHIETQDDKVIQVTVAHENSTFADAYATALFAMPENLRMKFLSENKDVGTLILYADGSVFMNEKFRDFFDIIIFKGGAQYISKTNGKVKK